MRPLITCTFASSYHLTRGQQYELISHDAETKQVHVRADNGQSRWFAASLFDLSGGHVPVLTAWRFDDPVIDPLSERDETNNSVDIILKFDDGTQRWCEMTTPDYLKDVLDGSTTQPMHYPERMIIVRDLATATVEQVLVFMDQQNELIPFSLPFTPESSEEEGTQEAQEDGQQ